MNCEYQQFVAACHKLKSSFSTVYLVWFPRKLEQTEVQSHNGGQTTRSNHNTTTHTRSYNTRGGDWIRSQVRDVYRLEQCTLVEWCCYWCNHHCGEKSPPSSRWHKWKWTFTETNYLIWTLGLYDNKISNISWLTRYLCRSQIPTFPLCKFNPLNIMEILNLIAM